MRWQEGLIISCLVDTDVCIDYLRKRDYARTLFLKWMDKGLFKEKYAVSLGVRQCQRLFHEIGTTEHPSPDIMRNYLRHYI